MAPAFLPPLAGSSNCLCLTVDSSWPILTYNILIAAPEVSHHALPSSRILVHEVVLLLLLPLRNRSCDWCQEFIEGRKDSRGAFLYRSVCDHEGGCSFWRLTFLVSVEIGQMVGESNALRWRNVKGLREFFNPEFHLRLRLGIICIVDDDDSLCTFLDCWPAPIKLCIACVNYALPETSQNSIVMRLFLTSFSVSIMRTPAVGL